MPLRIAVQDGKDESVVRLHGWLSGQEVAEFERVVSAAPIPLSIDLAQLAGADRAGVAALHHQRERGARLTNASPYIQLLLEEPDPGTKPAPGVPRRGGGRG